VVVRFVALENVLSIIEEGTSATVNSDEAGAVGETSMSWIVSGERDGTSIACSKSRYCARDPSVSKNNHKSLLFS
jgi:hypothetical protein